MMKNKGICIKILKDKRKFIRKGIIFFLSWILIYGILIGAVLPEKYSLKEGEIAKVDIKSPRDAEDELSTKEKKIDALKNVAPQYTVDSDIKKNTSKNIETFFSKVDLERDNFNNLYLKDNINIKDEEKNVKIEELAKTLKLKLNISLDEKYIVELLKLNEQESKQVKENILDTMSKLYNEYQINSEIPEEIINQLNDLKFYEGTDSIDKTKENEKSNSVISSKENLEIKSEDKKKAVEFIENQLSKNKVVDKHLDLAKEISFSQLKPNIFFDEDKTKALKKEALQSVEPIKVKKDQMIVKEGEPVSKYQIELLRQLGFLEDKNNFQWAIYTGLGVLIAVVLAVQNYYIYKYQNETYKSDKLLVLVSVINLISLIFTRLIGLATAYLIPLAFAPMMITLLLNYKLGIAISIFNGIFLSVSVKFDPNIVILIMMNAVIGSVYLKKMDQRSDILYSSLIISIINALLVTCLTVLQANNNFMDILIKSSSVFGAGILSGVFAIGFLPVFESMFGIVTTVKLLELLNPNNPLLKKLLIEAPGTYHHCVLVANLAELAAEAIGANAILARTGAYYHDVGKLKRPIFFKENQMGRQNPHDKIGPNLSTLIITSHTKDGVELAKEYKIPKVIQDIIMQHHGTSLVKYFYITAKNTSDKPEDILEDDFRYEGPKPQSKEAAIVMLADGSEAAVRSIQEPTEEKVENMVNNIIKGVLEGGNLDECDITFKDLEKIKKAFLKALSGIYHERIEYPKLASMKKNRGVNK